MMRFMRFATGLSAAAMLGLLVTISGNSLTEEYESSGPTESWKGEPVVMTRYGLIRGYGARQNTWSWKGIPYAAPPVGPLRWKAPVDPKPWETIRSGRIFGNSASQLLPLVGPYGSEDCLYLNIWRPKGRETGLPVYLFIHGGANSLGTSALPDYFGNTVSRKSDMVYVSVNYRLNVLGWFRHPAVTGNGSPADRSGNFGTLDLIKALEWVRDNISAFGGDPGNVTIAGESAGAMNVLTLLISRAAKGLFHRAIAESGIVMVQNTADAEISSAKLLTNLLVSDGTAKNEEEAVKVAATMSYSKIDAYFRSKYPAELMKNIPDMAFGIAKWPYIYTDGFVIPEEGYAVLQSGNWANQVPLLIGVNKDEAKWFRWMLKDVEPGTESYEIHSRYQSLLWRIVGLDSVATAITAHRDAPPVFAYRFDWGSPDAYGISVLPKNLGEHVGAHHHAEIPFFLGTGLSELSVITGNPFTKENRQGRKKLTDLCMAYLANFAKTGDPNGDNLPVWKPWNPAPGADKLIILDAGLHDLRISALQEAVTYETLLSRINTELKEPRRGEILRILTGPSPLGIIKD